MGLLEEEHWMMEVHLGDIETSLGEQEEYWLVAVTSAWMAATFARQCDQTTLGNTVGEGH